MRFVEELKMKKSTQKLNDCGTVGTLVSHGHRIFLLNSFDKNLEISEYNLGKKNY